MNVEKMRKLQAFLRSEPRRFDQNEWLTKLDSDQMLELKDEAPPCGTVMCLAGSACLMEGYIPFVMNNFGNGIFSKVVHPNGLQVFGVEEAAAKILDLPLNLGEDLTPLFQVRGYGWSEENRAKYQRAKSPADRVEAACSEIDRLIEEYERSNNDTLSGS